MKKTILTVVAVLFLGAVTITACSSQKGPAEAAIKGVEEALNASKAEAAKYVPEKVKSIEEALVALKDKFGKGDYKEVVAESTTLLDQAKGLVGDVKAKKDELTKSWTDLSGMLPKMVEAVQGKVDLISKTKKLPSSLTKEGFEESKGSLLAIKEEWTKAQENFTAGNLTDAVSAATSIKEKVLKVMETLGVAPPAPTAG